MKSTHTTTAALALALSVFLAHGAAAQTDTRSTTTPTNPTATQPMNSTSNPSTNPSSTYDTTNPGTASTATATTSTGGSQSLTGKVVTKNADSVVVLNDAGQRVTVYTDASSTLPTSTWAVGDRVTVSYTTPTAGRNHADTIILASAPSTSYPSSTASNDSSSYPSSTATTNDTATTSSSTLPKTASSTPLALLLGSFAGAAAIGLHLARRNA